MKLWKFCAGYVNISIVGKYPEKLVNRLLCSGIRLENLQRTGGGLSARVSARDMRAMRSVARGSGCRIRVLEKHGGPVIRAAIRANRAFIAFLAAFLAAAAFASTRIWFIDIDTVSIPREEIARVLSAMGVERGCSGSGLNTGAVAEALSSDPRVVNAKVTLRGVVLRVEISETEGYAAQPASEPAVGFYADRDCVIRELTVKSGRAMVAPGQAVRKGDLIISGDLSDMKEGFSVPAEGKVMGEVLHVFSASAPPETVRLVRSGEKASAFSILLFGRELAFDPPFVDYEREPIARYALNACPVPLGAVEYECFELTESMVEDTPEGTETRARLLAQRGLTADLPHDAQIKTLRTDIIRNGDGSVTAIVTATALERIYNGN